MSLPAIPQPTARHRIAGHDGTTLNVPEFGQPDGLPLILVHGWSQAHLSWAHQLTGPLADTCRIVTPDLRGHGWSDKPQNDDAYDSSLPWASDIAAIIDALYLDRPVVVGWSMGGRVVQDYLHHFGDNTISGVMHVGCGATWGSHISPEAQTLRGSNAAVVAAGMQQTEDVDAELRAVLAFLDACTAKPMDRDELAYMAGFNMMCPPHVRRHRGLAADHRDTLARLDCPQAVLFGAQEQLMPPVHTDELVRAVGTPAIVFEDSGHCPFWEEPDRFNTELLKFVQHCRGRK